jgi:hypothetical protein
MNLKLPQTSKITFLLIQIFLVTLLIAGATKFISDHPISTIFKAGSAEKEVQLTFHPQDLKPEPGDMINITPFLTAKAKKPGFITISLRYDNVHLIYDSFDSTHLSDKYESLFPIEPIEKEVNGKKFGFIQLTYAIKDPANLPEESIELSRLTFKIVGRDKTSITVNQDETQIVFSDQDVAEIIPEHVNVDSQEKPTQTPSILPSPSVNPKPTAKETESTPTPQQPTLEPTVTPNMISSTIAPSEPPPTIIQPE